MSDVVLPVIAGNVGSTGFPSNAAVTLKAKTNSRATQRITITSNDQDLFVFTGSGEMNTVIGQSTMTFNRPVQAKFEYLSSDQWVPSRLNCGGPYQIGSYNLVILVAENGDDSDYNDSILEFSWYTPK